ncbi:MAG: FmdB family transcriptional regulator [Actinobacteria bacterium]|nr:FmdB family transcriptional regulator [Actinomycetota bacterium]MBI3688501.1 FmdB family transcriptional regulator [Actinomycetota bacterium]
MPTYQYACTVSGCGHEFEAVQGFAEDALTSCPACTGRLRKVYSAVGVVFKGPGFYRTDSRSDGSSGSGGSSGGTGPGSAGSGSGGSGAAVTAGAPASSSPGPSSSSSNSAGSSGSGSGSAGSVKAAS